MEKVALLETRLKPRVSEKALKNLHATMNRILAGAKHHCGWRGRPPGSIFAAFTRRAKAAAAEEHARGVAIVTRRPIRRAWSDERLTALFGSPRRLTASRGLQTVASRPSMS